MKMGLCAEDAVTHNLTVVWTGLDTRELKEGEQLEIRVAGHWIEVELERDPDGGWSWRDPETYRCRASQCPENRRLKLACPRALKAPPGQAIITNKNRELTSLIIYAE